MLEAVDIDQQKCGQRVPAPVGSTFGASLESPMEHAAIGQVVSGSDSVAAGYVRTAPSAAITASP